MRVLILAKRQYTGKDLLDDRYGRLFEIPAELARLGHDVRGLALSYRKRREGWHQWPDHPNMKWLSRNAMPFGLVCYQNVLANVTDGWVPDVVWASSDMLHAVMACHWARLMGLPVVIDLYDNYESFSMSRLPFLASHFRTACNEADGVTAVSKTLASYVAKGYGRREEICVLPNGVRKDLFRRHDKKKSRDVLGLPVSAKLIGTAGAISDSRGIRDLFDAFHKLVRHDDQLWLAIAGPADFAWDQYRHARIIDLGVLPFEKIPYLLSALDVGVVCNRDSNFGRYCFPLKLHEMLSCGVPVVAAAIGDVAEVLCARQDCLYTPGDPEELASCIAAHLQQYSHDNLPQAPSWQECAKKLEYLLTKVCLSYAGNQ